MRVLNQLVAASALAFVLASPGFAADVTEAQKAALAESVSAFQTAMTDGDVDAITSTTPPKVLEKIATDHNMSVDQLKAAIADSVKQAMARTKFTVFKMDVDGATYASLPDGAPYAELPTDMQFDVTGKGSFKEHTSTLALLDDGTWYLVRVDDENQTKVLKQVYPGFADVTFPTGTLEPVTP